MERIERKELKGMDFATLDYQEEIQVDKSSLVYSFDPFSLDRSTIRKNELLEAERLSSVLES